uniref:Type I-B CRISPR-associated protein Cas8b1/Cst1 n=1 Tax=Schlesneria paludicola TaxID=360056 RepID=A0A7C4QT91_9PLAN
MSDEPLLNWTGHPLADVGVATLCAMAGKDDPRDLTIEDLDAAGEELRAAYTDPVFTAYLSCVFTLNSPYTNPTISELNRVSAINRLVSPHRVQPDEGAAHLQCVFSGKAATHLLDRAQMPMLTGAGVLNFFPAGRSELPVAAPYVLAIQALALGGRCCEGKLLIVHCDHPRFTLEFASRYLARNRQLINLAMTNRLPEADGPSDVLEREWARWDSSKKRPKYPDAKAPESLVMQDLLEIVSQTAIGDMAHTPCSVTVYLISNSGQGPSLVIEHIPGQFVAFLEELHGPKFESRWKRVVQRAWQPAKGTAETGKKRAGKKSPVEQKPKAGPGISRNELYNDLARIFETGECDWSAATCFIRRHLLSDPSRISLDPRRLSSQPPRFSSEQLELIDWELSSLFLEKVLGMNHDRLKKIRDFADQLADLIDTHNDRALFRQLVFTAGEWQYRAILTKVQRQYAHDRNALLFGFDDYLNIFLAEDAGDRANWSLIRDLISIRLVEQLFQKKFFDRAENRQVLEESAESPAAAVN